MPQLLLFICLALATWLIKRDIRIRPGVSRAIWIPTVWVGIIASRPVSAWLGLGGGTMDTLDGSPADRMFFLMMILASLVVLSRRGVDWGWLLVRNWPVVLFYTFWFISIAWTNSPFSSLKRWSKEIGNIFVLLVILTEADPMHAFRAVFVRCAYLLIPLSIIFIRYFPDIGRRYSRGGVMESIGVTPQKNSLGTMVLTCGLVFTWDWLARSRPGALQQTKIDRLAAITIAVLAAWLLYTCDSKTSMLSLIAGVLVMASIRFPQLRRRITRSGMFVLMGAVVLFLLNQEFGISETIIKSLGRDMTFTGRTDVWRELLKVGTDPLLGTGFMSFWDDPQYQSQLPEWVAFSAHNGYLETYLAGGYVGLTVLIIMLLATTVRMNNALADGSDYSVIRFAILVMMLMANFAESNFACMTPLGFLFLIATIGHARPESLKHYSPNILLADNNDVQAETGTGLHPT